MTKEDLGTSLQPLDGSADNKDVLKPHQQQSDTDRKAWIAAAFCFVAGVLLIGMVVWTRSGDTEPPVDGDKKVNSPVGWLGAAGAIIVFGSSQLLVNLDQLAKTPERARPGLLACFSALGNGVTNVILCLIFRSTGLLSVAPTPQSILWGFLGALDVNTCQLLAAAACQCLGVGAAPAIWCGIGMATSFVWGAAIFGEPITGLVGAILGLVALAIGIGFVAAAQTSLPSQTKAWMAGSGPVPLSPGAGLPKPDILRKGFLLTLLMGVIDGSLMAPYKLFVTTSKVEGPAASELTYRYIESFGIMVLVIFPVLMVTQSVLWRVRQGNFAGLGDGLRWCFWPGFWTGVFWALGNACSVHASEYLGVALGFPLTQSCVVICALWGVALFGEMKKCEARVSCGIGIVIVLVGACLLGLFGQ